MTRSLVACLLSGILLCGTGARSETYQNGEYKFEADLSDRWTVCTTPPPAPNHGFALLLYSKDCDRVPPVEEIEVIAEYNVPYEARSSRELGTNICGGAAITQSREKIRALRFLRCGPIREKALLRTSYFALRPYPPDRGDWTFGVTVYCRPEHAKACDRALRDTFHRIRFTD